MSAEILIGRSISRRAFTAGIATAGVVAGGARRASAQQTEVVRLALNPQLSGNLPLFLAIDRGYFAKQNIRVEVQKIAGASSAVTPMLARGDLDITPQSMSPSFFNQFAQGFDAKIVAAMSAARRGWGDTLYLVVRQDVWDAGLRNLGGLRGKSIDMANFGTPINLLVVTALKQARIAETDVKLTTNLKNPTDWFAALRNKAVDVIGAIEPVASQLQAEGLGHKWLSLSEVVPWYQPTYLIASSQFIQKRRDVAVRFLLGYLAGSRDVAASRGRWNPGLVGEMVSWSGMTADVIESMAGPVYPGDMGAIDGSSLARIQDFWQARDLVKQPQPQAAMIDATLLDEARRKFR